MKKRKNIFIIIFICLFLSLGITLRADSGWDGSYDGGGSSWDSGGSSWSGSDWGSSSHDYNWSSSGGTSSSDLSIMGVLFAVCILITIVIVLSKSKNKNIPRTTTSESNNYLSSINEYDINKIKEIIPNFDVNDFRSNTFDIYKNIQIAWMNFDYDTLKKYTTNELYNLYKSELMALKVKKQKNVMSNFSLLDFKITDMEKGTDDLSIKVRMKVMCKDYVTNQNDKIVRGNDRFVTYGYEMTFTKGLVTKDNKCPNCNAPLDNVQTSECPYCGSTVISSNHDWVLSKKQIISQRR